MLSKILKIEELDEIEMVDIEVSGNHLFYANNILTHNSSNDIEITDTSECIDITQKVEMRDGSIKIINDLCIGDQVKSNDEYKTVMFRHHNKFKDCIKIKTKMGKEIIVSKDHVFPTKKLSGKVLRSSFKDGLVIGDKLNVKLD